MKTQIANQVRATDDYNLFTLSKENRGAVQDHIRKLARSMRDYGWIDSFPMMVVEKGDKLEIRDGQNRFRAAQQLGIPVKYVITENSQRSIPISELNKNQKTWTTIDYCKSYANQGSYDYQELIRFMHEEYMSVYAAVYLLTKGLGCDTVLKNGTFKIIDLKWAKERAAEIQMLSKIMPFSPASSNFVRVFAKACLVKGFEPHIFCKKVQQAPERVKNMATTAGIALMIEDVYNYRSHEKIPLAHEISQISQNNRKR